MLEHEKKYGRFTCYASTPLENRCWVDGINFMLIYFFESDLSQDFLSKGTNFENGITHISNNIPFGLHIFYAAPSSSCFHLDCQFLIKPICNNSKIYSKMY